MKIVRILGSEAAILVVLVDVKDSVYIVYIRHCMTSRGTVAI